jgi:hypothetical protein
MGEWSGVFVARVCKMITFVAVHLEVIVTASIAIAAKAILVQAAMPG